MPPANVWPAQKMCRAAWIFRERVVILLSMKKEITICVALLLAVPSSFSSVLGCEEIHHLFAIERSKNGNVVQYDFCVGNNGESSETKPVKAYWILENGEKEDLNFLQQKYAYGIKSQEKLSENKYRIVLTAFKDRMIIVEKIDNFFKAVLPINGKESILEKIYVKAEDRFSGFPKVYYIDLFGRARKNNLSVKERILVE